MFESVMISLNNFPISPNPLHYGYRSYLQDIMTYGSDVKSAQMTSQGWLDDLPGNFGPDTDNQGFISRMNRFRENGDDKRPYKAGGTIFSKY